MHITTLKTTVLLTLLLIILRSLFSHTCISPTHMWERSDRGVASRRVRSIIALKIPHASDLFNWVWFKHFCAQLVGFTVALSGLWLELGLDNPVAWDFGFGFKKHSPNIFMSSYYSRLKSGLGWFGSPVLLHITSTLEYFSFLFADILEICFPISSSYRRSKSGNCPYPH